MDGRTVTCVYCTCGFLIPACPFHIRAGLPLEDMQASRSVVLTWNNLGTGGFTLTAGPDTDAIRTKMESVLQQDTSTARDFLRAIHPGPPKRTPQDSPPTVATILEIINDMLPSGFGFKAARHGHGSWATVRQDQKVMLTRREYPYLKGELHYFAHHMWYFLQVYAFSACPEMSACGCGDGDKSRTALPANWRARLLTDPKELVNSIHIALRGNRNSLMTGAAADKYANFMRGLLLSFTQSEDMQESLAGTPVEPSVTLRSIMTRMIMSEAIWDAARVARAEQYLEDKKHEIAAADVEDPEKQDSAGDDEEGPGQLNSAGDLALDRMVAHLKDMETPMQKKMAGFGFVERRKILVLVKY